MNARGKFAGRNSIEAGVFFIRSVVAKEFFLWARALCGTAARRSQFRQCLGVRNVK